MIDLFNVKESIIQLKWIDGNLIMVQPPTMKLITQITTKEVEAQKNALLQMLNRNTSARKFTMQDINDLSIQQYKAVIEGLAKHSAEVENHPNV